MATPSHTGLAPPHGNQPINRRVGWVVLDLVVLEPVVASRRLTGFLKFGILPCLLRALLALPQVDDQEPVVRPGQVDPPAVSASGGPPCQGASYLVIRCAKSTDRAPDP